MPKVDVHTQRERERERESELTLTTVKPLSVNVYLNTEIDQLSLKTPILMWAFNLTFKNICVWQPRELTRVLSVTDDTPYLITGAVIYVNYFLVIKFSIYFIL